MTTVHVNRFDGGIAASRFTRSGSQCGVCKHFDTTTFPNKLVPYRGMAANTTGQSGIGNMFIGTNGIPYGLGTVSGVNNSGQVYDKATILSDWASMTNGTVGGSVSQLTKMRLFVEFNAYGYFQYDNGATAGIAYFDLADSAAIATHTLSITTMANGVVHPATGYLYVGYNNKIWQVTSVGGSPTTAALTLPTNAVITCISVYGNFLAISARIGSSTSPRSKVFFWDLNTTNTWSDSVDWGAGDLQIINEFEGALIGVAVNSNSGYSLDRNGVTIKRYSSGGFTKIAEISTERQTSTDPSAQINPNVNFVHGNKFYFSADIVGGSTSPKYYGLWSLSRSPITGEYSVAIERGATDDNSETSVLAAVLSGDYAWMVHTAAGTVTRTNGTSGVTSTTYAGTSFYETVVNPGMSSSDYDSKKKLLEVRGTFYLPDSTSQITVKYRVDRATSWTTVFTKTTTSPNTDIAGYRTTVPASGQFTDARYIEFRIESIGGAEFTGLSYTYQTTD